MTLGFKPLKVILIHQIVICPVVDRAIQRLNNRTLYIPIRGLIIFNKRPWRDEARTRYDHVTRISYRAERNNEARGLGIGLVLPSPSVTLLCSQEL